MSLTFILSSKSSVLTADFNPPIILDPNVEYVMGLTTFETFNSIPNVTKSNNQLKFEDMLITVDEGSYELADLNTFINSKLTSKDHKPIKLTANNNTLKTKLKTSGKIDFNVQNSIAPLLGFHKTQEIARNSNVESPNTTNILKVNSLLIECNITSGNYNNGQPSHVIHQFFPSVPPGYKIIESPDHVIYLPINVNTLTNITLKIVDQDGDLVNFRGEAVTIALHLKSVHNGISI